MKHENHIADLAGEEWREIPDTRGWYFVSNLGRVKSIDRRLKSSLYDGTYFKKGGLMKPINIGNGYYRVRIPYTAKVKMEFVHRLVASAFIPNPEEKTQVNHINGHPHDNRLENLQWHTPSENNLHCFFSFGRKDKRALPVIKHEDQLIEIYESFRKTIPPVKQKAEIQNIPNEKWMAIPNTDEGYWISSMGRIKSVDRVVYNQSGSYLKEGRLLKTGNANGYRNATIVINGIPKLVLVHRIVAEVFIPNSNNLKEVNHLNGVKSDNRLENLEWASRIQNIRHVYKELKYISHRKGKTLAGRRVKCDTYDIAFNSINEAANAFGLSRVSVATVCKGDRNSTQGLTFRYL